MASVFAAHRAFLVHTFHVRIPPRCQLCPQAQAFWCQGFAGASILLGVVKGLSLNSTRQCLELLVSLAPLSGHPEARVWGRRLRAAPRLL